ncbi:DUF992 domain-containing protein [Methylobacterium sp. R2-1]|uniref:DUF992 domain-containing protein n=1 Tax=Methylobacterium sp. R2-1 TaxID=2587064 RepID=UPI00161FAF5C|nr:DUF992 domain-containing protein [Methylobacterium sp. R2-1]MBB2963715.1 hypothetical protein [Methylobacterium sp. R2-1]
MRSLTLAFTVGILAAGAAYAHGLGSESPAQQTAGILTCVTKPEASLVFGRTPVADCTFAAERGGFRQSYVAVFSPAATTAELETAQKVTWRVLTKGGFSRPGMLADNFTAPQSQPAAKPELVGRTAILQLLSHSGQSSAKFALAQPRVQLAAAEPGMTR